MDAQLASLGFWHAVLLDLGLLLALEAADLLLVAAWTQRPWRERLLALVPALAFGWVLLGARGAQAEYDTWHSYVAFLDAHYPPVRYVELYEQTRQDFAPTLAGASRLGWSALVVTAALLALGWLYVARCTRPTLRARRASGVVGTGGSPTVEDDVEMTIEPMERPHRER